MVVKNSTEMWQNKRKAIQLILDFVKFPTGFPSVKYKHLTKYLRVLWAEDEITQKHYEFLSRVLDVEYASILEHESTVEGESK